MRMINCLLFFSFLLFQPVVGYNYLVFCPLFGHSHTTFFAKIADTLTDAGHNVTFLTPTIVEEFESKEYVKSTKHVVKLKASENVRQFDIALKSTGIHKFWHLDSSLSEVLPTLRLFQQMFVSLAENMYENIEVLEDLKNNYHYDAIIYECFVFTAFPVMDYLGIKTQIPAISLTHDTMISKAIGEPVMPSAVSEKMSPFDDRMTLGQRMINTIFHPSIVLYLGGPVYTTFTQPRTQINIEALQHHSAYFLINSNPYLDFPRPTITKTVQIGGISVNLEKMRAEKVDKTWDKILNIRPHNMLVSFGSVQRSEFMPDTYKAAIIEAMSKFPNVTFIWKYESDSHHLFNVKNLTNVHFEKWVPQRALLVDSRIDAFFTHAGLGSVNEVSYSGKPAILCPLFVDQMRNAKMLARHQGAIEYSKFDLDNSPKIEHVMRQILFNTEYTKNAQNLAKRLERQPIKPDQLLVKHCEFAAEFGELESLDPYSRQMSFISYFMIDQFLILFSIVSILLSLAYISVKYIYIRIVSRRNHKKIE